jgi:transcriptional regulator with XRE-family HTH domain
MDVKKTEKGWEYQGIVFSEEKSAFETKALEESSSDEAESIFVGSEGAKFVVEYDEKAQETFGKFIGSILKNNRMSLRQIAKEMSVSEQTIYTWMRGLSIPTPKHLVKLKEIAKCDTADIIAALNFNFENSKKKLASDLDILSEKKGSRSRQSNKSAAKNVF